MNKKASAWSVMVCSTAILGFMVSVVPHIGLLLLGLAFLGINFPGIVGLIGILLTAGSLLNLFPLGPAGLGDQLLQ